MIGIFENSNIKFILTVIFIFLSSLSLVSCENKKLTVKKEPLMKNHSDEKKRDSFNYNIDSPDEKYILPEILQEISDITPVNNEQVACVQDEKGIVFIYDLIENKFAVKDNSSFRLTKKGFLLSDEILHRFSKGVADV